MHWDTFKQDNYHTVGGDGDVESARYEPALLPPWVLNYTSCRDPPTPFLSDFSEI